MRLSDFFNLNDFDDVIKNFPSRTGSHRDLLLKELRKYYKVNSDLEKKTSIPADELIHAIWGKKKAFTDKEIKKFKKSFSALKSGVNRLLKQMHKKGKNPKGIRIIRGNRFGVIDAVKEDIIEQLSIKINALRMYLSKVETKIQKQSPGLSVDENPDAKGELFKDNGVEQTLQEMENLISSAKDDKEETSIPQEQEEKPDNLNETDKADDILAKSKKDNENEMSVKPRDVQAAYLDAKGAEMMDRDMFLDLAVEEEDISLEEKKKKEEEKKKRDEEKGEDKKEESKDENKRKDDDSKPPDVKHKPIKDESERRQIEDIKKELEEIREQKKDLESREKDLKDKMKDMEKREDDIKKREKDIENKQEELEKLKDEFEQQNDVQKQKETEEAIKRLDEERERLKKEKKELKDQLEKMKEELEKLADQLKEMNQQEKNGESVYEEIDRLEKNAGTQAGDLSTKEETDKKEQTLGIDAISPEEEVNFLKKAIGADFDEMKRSYAKLVNSKSGSILLGNERKIKNELPRKKVLLDEFYIGKYPIVNELFQQFVEKTNYVTDAEKMGYGWVISQSKWYEHVESFKKGSYSFKRGGYKKVKKANWRHPFGVDSGIEDKSNHPVVQVSYRDALAFCEWVGGELPTEFEWEYAAKAGKDDNVYSWGNEFDHDKCNSMEANILDTTSVDVYEGNEWMIFDVCANTWEWCENWYMRDYTGVVNMSKNPKGPVIGSYRALRGGCWFSEKDDVTTSKRWRARAMTWNNIISFRVIRRGKLLDPLLPKVPPLTNPE